MTASCISLCVILLLCSHLPEVSTECPLDKVLTDIEALNETVRKLENQKEDMLQSINPWDAKMLKCMTPPYIEGANIAMAMEENGKFKATYSCRRGYTNIGGTSNIAYCSTGVWSLLDIKCTDYTDCYGLHDGRAVYGGNVDRTAKGAMCKKWTDKDGVSFPNGLAEKHSAGNYCRDPSSDGFLWCYVASTWDYCSVPKCVRLQQ